jgi:hypothetical protein
VPATSAALNSLSCCSVQRTATARVRGDAGALITPSDEGEEEEEEEESEDESEESEEDEGDEVVVAEEDGVGVGALNIVCFRCALSALSASAAAASSWVSGKRLPRCTRGLLTDNCEDKTGAANTAPSVESIVVEAEALSLFCERSAPAFLDVFGAIFTWHLSGRGAIPPPLESLGPR